VTGYGGQADTSLQLEQASVPLQLLSPLAIEVLALLPLNGAELDAAVAQRVESNPLLAAGAVRRCRWCATRLADGACPRCGRLRPPYVETAETVDERETLRRAARELVPTGLAPAVDIVVGSLDEAGLLRDDLDEVAAATGWDPADQRAATAAVRAAGPPGVAAPSPRACLTAQATWHVANGAPALLVPLVDEQLERVAAGDLVGLADALQATLSDVRAAVHYLRTRLRPTALGRAGTALPRAAPPDVIVRRDGRDGFTVHVLDAADLGLTLDPVFPLPADSAAAAWLAGYRRDAQLFLDAVDRRAGALRRVGAAVVLAQHDFVDGGAAAHRPLTRTAIASVLGLHPSTVSRAVHGATVALPDGRAIPLAAFFGGAVATQARLAAMLRSDDPPRSDAEAADRLGREGHVVARRTVAKYRLALQQVSHRDAKQPSPSRRSPRA